MKNIFKTRSIAVVNREEIIELRKKLRELEQEIKKEGELRNVIIKYAVMGIPYVSSQNTELKLLMKAKVKGFFDKGMIFKNAEGGFGWHKHMYSSTPHNYQYWDGRDELRIPVIGIGDNYSAGTICIYKNGKWAKIKKAKK